MSWKIKPGDRQTANRHAQSFLRSFYAFYAKNASLVRFSVVTTAHTPAMTQTALLFTLEQFVLTYRRAMQATSLTDMLCV